MHIKSIFLAQSVTSCYRKHEVNNMNKQYSDDHIQYTDEQGNLLAEIDFPKTREGEITITHTFVDSSLKGQGIGKELILSVIDYAKKNNLKIRATCSFAIHYFSKNPSEIYID